MSHSISEITSLFDKHYQDLIRNYKLNGSRCRVNEAIAYVLEGEGKRVRPTLCLLTSSALGADPGSAISSALALEMIHTYSLVHDDLPCMDDDDLRRGRATAHKKFDEATAVLAGDGLLTDAFRILTEHNNPLKDSQKLAQVLLLSKASGSLGMVLGQSLDMAHTGGSLTDKETLDQIHISKTGELLGAAMGLGAIAAGSSSQTYEAFYNAGKDIGLAFQILDDLLDGSDSTGKSAGKDLESGKLTYLRLMSREEAHEHAKQLTQNALDIISHYTNSQDFNNYIEALLDRVK